MCQILSAIGDSLVFDHAANQQWATAKYREIADRQAQLMYFL